jgi:hypothetical protein
MIVSRIIPKHDWDLSISRFGGTRSARDEIQPFGAYLGAQAPRASFGLVDPPGAPSAVLS